MMPIHRTLDLSLLLAVFACAACGADEPRACAPGTSGCACDHGSACDDGLVCEEASRTCVGTRTITLPAIDADARSCEVLLVDDGAEVVRAEFGSTVHGELVRQAPRAALAFHADADAPVARDAVKVEVAGIGGVTIARARCFDRTGTEIPNAISTDG